MQNLGEVTMVITIHDHPLHWLMCDNLLVFTNYFLIRCQKFAMPHIIINIP